MKVVRAALGVTDSPLSWRIRPLVALNWTNLSKWQGYPGPWSRRIGGDRRINENIPRCACDRNFLLVFYTHFSLICSRWISIYLPASYWKNFLISYPQLISVVVFLSFIKKKNIPLKIIHLSLRCFFRKLRKLQMKHCFLKEQTRFLPDLSLWKLMFALRW